MTGIRSVVKPIKKTDFVWRYASNFFPTLNYSFAKQDDLSVAELEIVQCLNKDGIAASSADSLFGCDSKFRELEAAATNLLDKRKEEVEAVKLTAADEQNIGNKTFNLEMLGGELVFSPESVFARFAINSAILNIANAYFRMSAKLRYYNVWYTAASASKSRESQLWHFDREDNYILKVFLYLDDVDEGTGPFTYAPGTQRKGQYTSIKPEYFLEGNVQRTTDEQMAAVYPKSNWKTCTGKKGTIVFADTRGYHKGGEARTKDRLMYTCMFTSPASESKELIKLPVDFDAARMTRKELWALGIR